MKGLLIFLIIFGLLVFVHEFGHFIVAKKSGIRVREFSIGMGPKLFQKRRSTTTYTIRWLPLGGYVRLAGSDDAAVIDPGSAVVLQMDHGKVVRIDASESNMPIAGIHVRVTKADLVNNLTISGYENGDESETKTYQVDHDATIIDANKNELIIAPLDTQFQEAGIWQKLATNFAGPFMNIVLGFVVFMIWSFVSIGPQTTTVAKTTANSPASSVLQKGDTITAVNGKSISSFGQLQEKIAASKGKTISISYKRDGKTYTSKLTPQKKSGTYLIGVQAQSDNSFGAKAKRGWDEAVYISGMIFRALGNLVQHFSLNKLSGPVGIYSQTSQVSQMGFTYVLMYLAMISINLGIVNLVPIPGLDGGKLLLNLIELIRGKPISEEHETAVEVVGFVVLLVLIIAVTGNDIYRYFIK